MKWRLESIVASLPPDGYSLAESAAGNLIFLNPLILNWLNFSNHAAQILAGVSHFHRRRWFI